MPATGNGISQAQAPTQVVNTPVVTGGASSGEGGYLSNQKDAKESATAPKFGDVYNMIQAKYGARPEKPREIKKTLGKDDFLRIMITQMKHQDPTKPFNADQMATQIAQFTSVEQLQNVNQNLTKMAEQNKPLERMTMTSMIGKLVTVDRDRFPHAEGTNEALTFFLPKEAAQCHIAVISEAGETVLERDLGQQKAGQVEFSWDGLKTNTLPAKAGTYMFRVEAKDDRGSNIETNSQSSSRVIGVSFEGNEPVFLIGDAKHQEKITMKNITKIELDPQMISIPGALPYGGPGAAGGSAIQPVTTPKTSNFISFQKGVGSGGMGGDGLSPEAAEAIAKFQQQQQEKTQAEMDSGPRPAMAPGVESQTPPGVQMAPTDKNPIAGGRSASSIIPAPVRAQAMAELQKAFSAAGGGQGTSSGSGGGTAGGRSLSGANEGLAGNPYGAGPPSGAQLSERGFPSGLSDNGDNLMKGGENK